MTVRHVLPFVLSLFALSSCTVIFGEREEEERIAGFYILERVDGAVLPAELAPQDGCRRTVRKTGTFSLSGRGPDVQPMYDWTVSVDVECQPIPPGVSQGGEDVGTWRRHGSTLALRSMMDMGPYGATVEESSGNPPAVTLVFLGNSYRFRRIDDPTGVVFLKFVDQFGQPVAGVIMHFAFRYGLEGGGTTGSTGEFGTSGHIGACTISFTPPEGYEVPSSQPNPFSVTVPDDPPLRVQIVLTKTSTG